jgi:hypothetical protein
VHVKKDPSNRYGYALGATKMMTKLQNCDKVIATLKAMGFRVPDNCRIGLMRRAMIRTFETNLSDDGFKAALESERDMRQLSMICDYLSGWGDSKPFRDVAKFLTKDSVLPQDSTDSKGGDAQFHLYLAAICMAAGLQPTLEKLDIKCVFEGETYGIEAKRVKGPAALESSIEEAANQIRFEGIPGMIALELTRVLNPENMPTVSNFASQAYSMFIGQRIRDLIKSDRVQRLVRGKGVFAVVGFDNSIINPNGAWKTEEMAMWLDTNEDDPRMADAFEKLHRAMEKGMPKGGPMRPSWTGDALA